MLSGLKASHRWCSFLLQKFAECRSICESFWSLTSLTWGTETHTLGLARELMRNGAHVVVAAKTGRMLDAFAALGCPVYTVDFVTDEFKENTESKAEIIDYLKLIIRNEDISILHAHQWPSGIFAVQAAKEMNIPVVFTVHGFVDAALIPLVKECDTVLAVSQSIVKTLKANQVPSVLLQNGIDVSEFSSHKSTKPYVRASWESPIPLRLSLTQQGCHSRKRIFHLRLWKLAADLLQVTTRSSS